MNKARTYSYEDIQRYLQHKMDAKEMHAFESAMMNDPFLADAIEGYRSSNSFLAQNHLEEIKKQITTNKQPAKVVKLSSSKTAWWKVAAIVFIIVTGTAISYMLFKTPVKNEPASSQIAQRRPEEIPTQKDSIAADASVAQTENAPRGDATAYGRNAQSKNRINVKPAAPAMAIGQSKRDTPVLAMTDKMDERTLMTNNETASNRTMLNQRAATSPAPSATAANQELKEVTASDAPNKSEALPKRMPAKKDSNPVAEAAMPSNQTKGKRDLAGSISTIPHKPSGAAPEGGWQNFDDYVKREIESFNSSTDSVYNKAVALEFSIDEQGRPTEIQIIRDADKNIAGEGIIDKAIQILMNGPRWLRNKDQTKAKVTIRF